MKKMTLGLHEHLSGGTHRLLLAVWCVEEDDSFPALTTKVSTSFDSSTAHKFLTTSSLVLNVLYHPLSRFVHVLKPGLKPPSIDQDSNATSRISF